MPGKLAIAPLELAGMAALMTMIALGCVATVAALGAWIDGGEEEDELW